MRFDIVDYFSDLKPMLKEQSIDSAIEEIRMMFNLNFSEQDSKFANLLCKEWESFEDIPNEIANEIRSCKFFVANVLKDLIYMRITHLAQYGTFILANNISIDREFSDLIHAALSAYDTIINHSKNGIIEIFVHDQMKFRGTQFDQIFIDFNSNLLLSKIIQFNKEEYKFGESYSPFLESLLLNHKFDPLLQLLNNFKDDSPAFEYCKAMSYYKLERFEGSLYFNF